MFEEDLRAINEFLEKERKLTLKKDIESLLELYTEDVVMLPPDGDMLEGKFSRPGHQLLEAGCQAIVEGVHPDRAGRNVFEILSVFFLQPE